MFRMHSFDGLDRLKFRTQCPDGTFISNSYDRLDLSAHRDRAGKWTYFNYDSVQRLTNANNEAGQQLKVAHGDCGCGAAQSVANALAQTVFWLPIRFLLESISWYRRAATNPQHIAGSLRQLLLMRAPGFADSS